MAAARRARPTLRCVVDDLGLPLPELDVDLGTLDHSMMRETRRIAPSSPTGQKRILSIDTPLVYRIRVSDERGATWVEEERSIVWLCAVRRRQQGSDEDAFEWFAELHATGNLLRTGDDLLRDRAEAAIRLQRGLASELLLLLAEAHARSGQDVEADLGRWVPARILVIEAGGMQEVWCGIGVLAADGSGIPHQIRDLLFAGLEQAVQPAESEARADWPTGEVQWTEVVRLYVRAAE